MAVTFMVLMQITGDFTWARNQVSTIQQACVDDVLMRNYSTVNNTKSLNAVTRRAVGERSAFKCEPYDCNGHGRCRNGTCVCHTGRLHTCM